MSRQFIADVIKETTGVSQQLAKDAANDLIDALTRTLKREGTFNVPGFGTFNVRRTKARMGRNPWTGEAMKIRAGKTIRFKPSRTLKESI